MPARKRKIPRTSAVERTSAAGNAPATAEVAALAAQGRHQRGHRRRDREPARVRRNAERLDLIDLRAESRIALGENVKAAEEADAMLATARAVEEAGAGRAAR